MKKDRALLVSRVDMVLWGTAREAPPLDSKMRYCLLKSSIRLNLISKIRCLRQTHLLLLFKAEESWKVLIIQRQDPLLFSTWLTRKDQVGFRFRIDLTSTKIGAIWKPNQIQTSTLKLKNQLFWLITLCSLQALTMIKDLN